MALRVRRRERALRYPLGDPAVVLGQLAQHPAPEEVRPAVADVGDGQGAARKYGSGQGSPHSAGLRTPRRRVDLGVHLADRPPEGSGEAVHAGPAGIAGQAVDETANGHLTGNVSGPVTAHAVRDGQQRVHARGGVGPDQGAEGVLVGRACHPHVGERPDRHNYSRRVSAARTCAATTIHGLNSACYCWTNLRSAKEIDLGSSMLLTSSVLGMAL